MNRIRVAGIAVFVVAMAIVAAACGSADSPADEGGAPVELSLGDGLALASCLQFDTEILAGMPQAFAGTVISVEDETVVLSVDRWYRGGDAANVALNAPSGLEALIGGIDFDVDRQYLITAAEGTVNYCGFSGPATPELTAAFDEAFSR
ncbi:MAG TPA: hypothetical protein VLG28_16990 [Acidimicrobiia bacterium]|jgi:hypothetical protein|nr:hypothetical protein [Acidimicrobiia bacterium]